MIILSAIILSAIILGTIALALLFSNPGRKLGLAIAAQFNKLANKARALDPIAEMKLELDHMTDQIANGRGALEMYRGMVERVTRQVSDGRAHANDLAAKVRSYTQSGDRATAGKFAIELQTAEKAASENEAQLKLHQQAYENNLEKVKHATHKIGELRAHIQQKDADLRFSRAEKEIVKLGHALNFDTVGTSSFDEVERIVQDEIDANRASVQVQADLSGNGIEDIRREQDVDKHRAELALQQFEAREVPESPE